MIPLFRLFSPNSIARRLSLYILLTGALLTLFSLGFEAIFEYGRVLSKVRESLVLVEKGHLEPICQGLWTTDREKVRLQLNALVLDGAYATIRLPDNTVITSGPELPSPPFLTRTYPLYASFSDREIGLGTMTLVITQAFAYEGLFLQSWQLLLAEIATIFSMCFIFLITFHRLIGSNLQRFSEFVRSSDLDMQAAPFVLEGGQFSGGKDELSQLVEAFQIKQQNLQKTIIFLRESEERFRQFADVTQNGIITLNSNGQITFWNAAATRIFGYAPEEVMGQSLHQILVPQNLRTPHSMGFSKFSQTDVSHKATTGPMVLSLENEPKNHVSATAPKIRERQALCKDGSTRQVEISTTHVLIRGEWQAVGIVRDLTEQRKVEEASRDLLHQKEMNELKSKLVSMLSHEFRTPLAGVKNAAFLLKQPNVAANPESHARVHRILENSLHQMEKLLDQVTSLSREELSKIAFQPAQVEIGPWCQNACQDAATIWPHRKIKLTLHPGLSDHYFLDRRLLGQILDNLLSNALKFSSEDIDFEINAVPRPPQKNLGSQPLLEKSPLSFGYLEFLIRDRGIGIPEADQPRVFQTFQRARNVGNIQGTGLGLAIAQKFARHHGGEIFFTSKEGEGSTFLLRIFEPSRN